MGQEPEELRHDIERRRDDLAETLDAIGDRVSPGRILERRRNRVVETVTGFRHRVMGTVESGTSHVTDAAGTMRDHVSPDAIKSQTAGAPLALGAVAFGIGFLVAAVMPATEPETQAAQRLQDRLEPAKDMLTETGQHLAADVKQDASEAAEDLKATATDAASTVTDTAKEQARSAKDDAAQLRS